MIQKTHVILLLFLGVLAGLDVLGQARQFYKPRHEWFPVSQQHADKGWTITPGVTYMAGFSSSERYDMGGDTLTIQREEPKGRFGAFLQVGRFHAIDSRWLTYIDYGLDVRWLQGFHQRTLETRLGAENPDWVVAQGSGSFSDVWLGLAFNATLAKPLSRDVFLHHSMGVNANYAVVRSIDQSVLHAATTDRLQPPVINAQLHYKLGVGFKLGRGWYVIPTVETPILGIYAWNGAIPSLQYFDTYYQPILFGLTIMKRDRLKPEDCPTEGGSGKRRNKDSGLFEKGINKKYGW